VDPADNDFLFIVDAQHAEHPGTTQDHWLLVKTSNRHSLYASILLAGGLLNTPASADINRIYLEHNGYVSFEAEDAVPVADWELRSEIDGFRGAGYLEWTGPNYFSKANAGNGAISYHIRIETAGNYELRWRSRIAKGDSNTESNDSWVRLDTGSNVTGEEPLNGWTKVFMGEANTWSWSSRTVDEVSLPIRQYFSQGDHTVEISGRSNGHAIDQIALYRYPDVSFDAGLNGTLPLSMIMGEDGTIVDPNPEVIIEPEVTLSDRINVTPVAAPIGETNTDLCEANTLTLPVYDAASLITTNQTLLENIGELSLEPDRQNALLSFDLSYLPPFTQAKLLYSTGLSISNGSLDIYLASHSDWPANSESPDALVQVASAQGGWDAISYYETDLNASLLNSELVTLILSVSTGSDTLVLPLSTDNSVAPRLIISGGDDFCSSWQTNLAELQQSTPTVIEPSTIEKKSKSGSTTHWFWIALLLGAMGRITPINRERQ